MKHLLISLLYSSIALSTYMDNAMMLVLLKSLLSPKARWYNERLSNLARSHRLRMAEVGFERRQADALLCSQLHCHFSKQKRSHYHTKLVLGEKKISAQWFGTSKRPQNINKYTVYLWNLNSTRKWERLGKRSKKAPQWEEGVIIKSVENTALDEYLS